MINIPFLSGFISTVNVTGKYVHDEITREFIMLLEFMSDVIKAVKESLSTTLILILSPSNSFSWLLFKDTTTTLIIYPR